MTLRILSRTLSTFICTALLALPLAAEEIDYSYTLEKNHGIDFSDLRGGQLRVADFSDSRGVAASTLIDTDLGEISGGIQLTKPLSDIITDAVKQGFIIGDAKLVDEGEGLLLAGEITVSEATIRDRNGTASIQMTLRAKVQLRSGGSQVWQNTLFGRGYAPLSEGIEAALSNSLDRLVDSLVNDDYFLLQVL